MTTPPSGPTPQPAQSDPAAPGADPGANKADPGVRKAAIAGVFDRAAASYERVGPAYFGPIGAGLVARAGLRIGERVLDVGCGRGHCLFPAAEAIGPSGIAIGVDLAPGMVAATREEARLRGLEWVRVENGDAASPDLPAESFDVLLAGLVIFFMPDPDAALRAWSRLLVPGGRLAMSTFAPSTSCLDDAMRALGRHAVRAPGELRVERPGERLRDAEEVRTLVERNGFRHATIEETSIETRFTGPGQWWEWVSSHGGRAVIEKIPADRLEEAREDAFAAIRPALAPSGALTITTPVRYTIAAV